VIYLESKDDQLATGCDSWRGEQPALTMSSLGALPMMIFDEVAADGADD
jgi:hypothetical protein